MIDDSVPEADGIKFDEKSYRKSYYLKNREVILNRSLLRQRKNKEQKRLYDQARFQKNKIKMQAQSKIWAEKNPLKTKEIKRANRIKYKKERLVYHYTKLKTDIQYRLRCTLRARFSKLRKAGSCIQDLGCTVQELRCYLESKFKPGMTWDNWGVRGWHIDHIKPLAFFDLTKREEFLVATHFSNLQPLWSQENLIKGAKCV